MHETNDTPLSGLILLSQPEQLSITPKDMVDALPYAYKALPRMPFDLDVVELARQAIRTRDWGAAQRALEERVRRELVPLRDKHPDYRIIYFGSSPIPLTVHLGFLLETWQGVEVIPHHHARRLWGWSPEPARPPARLKPVRQLDYRDNSSGEAVIRVSTSHLVDPQATQRVVLKPLVDIDIELEHPAEDAFSSMEEMQEVAQVFRDTLDAIGDRFPGIQRVHLFASVQPGMALLLGAQISKTMHPAVQTYQYTRNAENEPYHVPAVLANGPSQPELQPLTEDEKVQAAKDREHLARALERMKGRAQMEQRSAAPNWLAGLLSKPGGHPGFASHWLGMPALHETPLLKTEVDLATHTVDDSFRYVHTLRVWQIDDHWLARLAKRHPDEVRRARALRMLVLHELAHRGPQMLTSKSSKEIGRFPKVLEEIDYHADVWAMLYEYALTEQQSPREVADPQEFFLELIRVATETMWAFDDDGQSPREFQIRRLNRYLIWYWQYLLLEHGAGQGRETTLDFVLSLLAQRPIIEMAGPTVFARHERVFFALDTARVGIPELALYHEGKLYRHGARYDFSIDELLDGVRMRDGMQIREVLRSAFEQTVR
ncbi:hypothetical protein D187_005338 [Cystobacter fuscus DSM 2262]|uniref:SMODS-associated and fused to various effectors domain-containing protein n=1 Tax=Cystobacter fuscus (strain ATCC 25194 / DSM 2262 / NBRC 100088 / M29) TaxID=1242864 RepID=S9QSF0_CYSF2|nr:SAVED domain-containing protein [Cystobacter fuscus]EPX64204.1 hypothetical protein D187_005338 [Cystobacter fuscus DSM 2262]